MTMCDNAGTSDTPQLPDVQQSLLDAEGVRRLIAEITQHAEVTEVIPRGNARQYVGEGSVTLEEGRDLLLGGCLTGLQIRYRYEGAVWWDTLLCTPQGVRVVRIRPDFQP